MSVWPAITYYYKMSSLTDKPLFLTVLESGKSKIKVRADSMSTRGPLFNFSYAYVYGREKDALPHVSFHEGTYFIKKVQLS